MDDDTPLVIGADVKVSDRFDADDELRMSFPASGRAAYFSRADVERLRDHLTALLGDGAQPSGDRPVELVVGREYRLLSGARCSGSKAPESCFSGVTRVMLETLPDSEGDVKVTFLDGPPSYVGSRGWWVSSRFLAPLDEPNQVALVEGRVYRLLPTATYCRGTQTKMIAEGTTRVRLDIATPDGDGDVVVTPLDGETARHAGYIGRYVHPSGLAPLAPLAQVAGKASLADIAQAARKTAEEAERRGMPSSRAIWSAFADELEKGGA